MFCLGCYSCARVALSHERVGIGVALCGFCEDERSQMYGNSRGKTPVVPKWS